MTHTDGVWAHLESWIVQDGQIPELHTGSTLHQHALRAACWSIHVSRDPEGLTELAGPDPSADDAPHYELTGTVEAREEPSRVLLRVGGFRVLAEPIDIRRVPGTSWSSYALERFSPDFFVPPVGTRLSVVCRLEVMAEHETGDAIGSSVLRRDWVVQNLKLQHRALVPVPGLERARKVGKVLQVEDIERMHRWADEKRDAHVTYLLDLQDAS